MATVNIDGDASGAIAACAAAQGAIDALHGKTVNVDINTRGGGAGGMGEATKGMRDFSNAADRASRSTQGMGDHLGRAGGHMGRMANDAGRLRDHLAAVDNVLRGGAPSSIGRSGEGMRALAGHADTARQSISGIGAESSRSMGAIESGAGRAGGGMRQLGAGAESASRFMVGTSGAAQRVSKDLVPMAAGADGVYRSVSRMAGAGSDLEKFAGSMRTIDAVGRSIDGGGGGSGGGLGGLLGKLGGLPDVAMPSARAIRGVGLAAGVSALGMGALTAAVAGVGLAGVAEDFAHNSQLMHAGEQAMRGFNREFSAMKGQTTAAGAGPMAGVATSMKGVGHELAALGAANIAPVLNSVSSLGNQATQAMQKLAPSIGPATQGLTALAGAVIGAFGDSGPAVTSFANTVTANAPKLQALTSDVINFASNVGSFAVDAAAVATDVGHGIQKVAGAGPNADNVADTGRSWFGGRSFSPLSAVPDNGINPLSLDSINAGPKARAGAAGTPGAFDPSKPFSGMLPDGSGGFTVGTGDGAAPKPAKPARSWGNFGPGSGGPATPPGTSAADIMTQQRADVGLPPVGQPHYSGIGPRGPGQSVGPMPVNAAIGLGGGGLAPLNDMMRAATSQVGSGGGGMGAAAVQHIQKAVHQASPAATSGGASLGAAMTGGMAQGVTSTQTVTDTVIIKHLKKMLDSSAEVLGVHSPSDEYDYLGRMSMLGYARGFGAEDAGTFGALTAAHAQASRFSPDYAGATAPTTISFRRKTQDPADPSQDPSNPLLSTSSTSVMPPVNHYGPTGSGNIQAHNDRAAQLAQGRADLHAKAMANLGAINPATGQKWQDPTKANSNPLAGTPGDPFAQKQSLGQKAGNLWQQLNQTGPQDGLPGLKKLWNDAGQSSAQGLTLGMTAHIPKVQAAGASVASAGHVGYKKKDEQSSPSAVWAGMGGNSVAGLAGGITGGTGMVVGAVGGMSDAMHAAGGQLSDRGLVVGYSWAQNVITGVSTQIKKADYQSMGIPQLGQAATRGLAATGLLSAGSGAQSYKTPGNTPGLVTLAPTSGSGGNQSFTVNHNINIDGQMHTVATQVFMDHLGQITDVIPLQQAA